MTDPFNLLPTPGSFGSFGSGSLTPSARLQLPVAPLPFTPAGGMSVPNQSVSPPAPAPVNNRQANLANADFAPSGAQPTPGGGLLGGMPAPGQGNLDLGAGLENYGPRAAGIQGLLGLLNMRPGPATVVKGGEVQTGRSVQTALGPRPETIKAYLTNQSDSGTLAAGQGLLEGKAQKVAGENAAEREKIETDAAQKQADAQAKFEERRKNLFGQIDSLQQQIQGQEIDSNRFWKKASTPNKIAAVFAVTMGAVGSALSGQPNLAFKKLDEAVDADLRDQVANIDKQRKDLSALQSVYLNAREALGDDRAAFALAKEQALRGVAAKLDADLGGIKSDQAVLKGEQLRGQILKEAILQKAEWEKAMLGQQNVQFATVPDKVVGGGGMGMGQRIDVLKFLVKEGYDPKLIEAAMQNRQLGNKTAAQNSTIMGPDGTLYQRPPGMQDGQWAEVTKRMVAGNQAVRLADKIAKTEDENTFATTGWAPTAASKERRALATSLQTAIDEHAGQGQASEAALKNATDLLTGGGAKAAAEAMKAGVLNKTGDVVQTYGLIPVGKKLWPQQTRPPTVCEWSIVRAT